jgi:hypothetical protein
MQRLRMMVSQLPACSQAYSSGTVVLLSRVHQGQLSALEVEVNALDGPATTPLARAVTVKLVRASTRSTSKDNARSIAAIKELLREP